MPIFKRLFLTLCATFLVACGSSGTEGGNSFVGPRRWESFPVLLYADSKITQDSQSNDDLHDAMAFWEAKAGKRLFDYRGALQQASPFSGPPEDPNQIFSNTIWLQSPWPYDSGTVGKTQIHFRGNQFENALILLQEGTNFCSGDCAQRPNDLSRRKLIAHELGHFIGLDHVADPNNIMYPSITSGGTLDGLAVDIATLEKLTN